MKIDPYKELRVPRDADAATIKAAGKRRRRETHPDTSGADSAEAFHRVQTAVAVLSDPERRARYDRDGSIDEEPSPDNARTAAIGLIEAIIGSRLQAYLNHDMDPAYDPATTDLVGAVVAELTTTLGNIRGEIRKGERVLAYLRRFAERWSTNAPADPIRRANELRVEQVSKQLDGLRESVVHHEKAIEIAGSYTFEADKPDETYRNQAGFDRGVDAHGMRAGMRSMFERWP